MDSPINLLEMENIGVGVIDRVSEFKSPTVVSLLSFNKDGFRIQ